VGRHPRQPGALHCTFHPLNEAEAKKHLSNLVLMFWRNWELPLPIFPKTSLGFVRDGGGSSESQQVEKALRGTQWNWGGALGESTDPYVRRVLGGQDPTDPTWQWPELGIPAGGFHKCACFVFEPLLHHLNEKAVTA